MTKNIFSLGLLSGLLSGIASYSYARIYRSFLGADFSQIVSATHIFSACIFGCLLMAILYWQLEKRLNDRKEITFNLIAGILSFFSIIGPFCAQLPLNIDEPELFPGLAIPMHFFPLVLWLVLKPVFVKAL